MTHKIFRLLFVLTLIIGLVVVAAPQSARAAGPWYVSTTGSDANDCLSPGSPCATVNGALNKPGFVAGDTIRVAIGTYTGTGSEVVLLDKDTTLSGGWNATFTTQSGMSTIDGQGARGGMTVFGTVVVEHFAIQNGSTGSGAGIWNAGNITLNNSVISGNTATGYIGNYQGGGGIYNGGVATINNSTLSMNAGFGITNEGTLTVNSSTISDSTGYGIAVLFGSTAIINSSTISNSTSDGIFNRFSLTINSSNIINNLGRGVQNWNGGSSILNNSTVSGNQAGGFLIFSGGSIALYNSTVSNNTADSGGGIFMDFGTVILQNSILAGNTANSGPDCSGSITSMGYSLIGNTSGCAYTSSTGDLTNIDPILGPLQDNGGPTFTHALLPGSPAIDAGNPAVPGSGGNACLATDQRGVTRPQGTRCDIGAFELEADGGEVGEVTIDIKPGNKHNRIMIESRGSASVQVAILSTTDFNALAQVDQNSLTFGSTGDENSLRRRSLIGTPDCRVRDVNRDRIKDLVCSFLIGKTGFKLGDTVGILKGQTVDGTLLEGRDLVLITAPSYPSYP